MATETTTNIPESVQNICRDICRAAQNAGLIEFSGSFQPDWTVWPDKVNFQWSAGRHGEDSNQMRISSTVMLHTKVSGPTKSQGA